MNSPNPTKLTVNITSKARAALDQAAAVTNDTRTDVVSRALVVYAELLALPPSHGLTFAVRSGEAMRVVCVDRSEA